MTAPDFRKPIVCIRDAASPEDLRDQLQRKGIRWLSSRGKPESSRLRLMVTQATLAGYLQLQGPELYRCTSP
jgi:hypothetical protein